MSRELTATIQVMVGDKIKPFDELTKDELVQLHTNAAKRLSNSLSLYYTQHPYEYQYVKEAGNGKRNKL